MRYCHHSGETLARTSKPVTEAANDKQKELEEMNKDQNLRGIY